MQWPHGKAFAFTIFDDTDLQTLRNISPVYSYLSDLGFRTTKSVWPVRGDRTPRIGGITCEDREYRQWLFDLKADGFEIALHNVTYHTSSRSETVTGLETFRRLFSHYPYSMANHSGCHEAIYWGDYRVSGLNRLLYNALLRNKHNDIFQGHLEHTPLFWGDVCKRMIKYVRNFIFNDINTLKMCPIMPYHDPDRPYVNYWFAGSEGADINAFNLTVKEENQDRLQREGGACIMYAHFACGFYENGKINPRFRFLMERMSRLNGWFVPVHTLLDYILTTRGDHDITNTERSSLERKWLRHKVRLGVRHLLPDIGRYLYGHH